MVWPQNYQCNLAGFCTVPCVSLQALILPHNLSNICTTSQHLCNLRRLLCNLLLLLYCSFLLHQWCAPPNVLGGPCTTLVIILLTLSTLETSTPSWYCLYNLEIMLTVFVLLISVLIISLIPFPLMLMPSNSIQYKYSDTNISTYLSQIISTCLWDFWVLSQFFSFSYLPCCSYYKTYLSSLQYTRFGSSTI